MIIVVRVRECEKDTGNGNGKWCAAIGTKEVSFNAPCERQFLFASGELSSEWVSTGLRENGVIKS